MIFLVSKQRKQWKESTKEEYLFHLSEEGMITSISEEQSLEMLSSYKVIGLDIETLGVDCHNDKITLLQLGNFIDQIIIDCTTIDISIYKPFLENPDILKIGCNLKFDLQFLYKNNIWCTNVWDVMLAEYVLYNGINDKHLLDIYMKYATEINAPDITRKSLARKAQNGWYSLLSLVYEYTGHILKKSERENFQDYMSYDFLLYSAEDVKYLQMVYIAQLEKIKKDGCYVAVYIENGFVEVLAYIEYCGLKLDTGKWMSLYEKNLDKYNELLSKLNKWIYDNNLTKYQDLQMDLFSSSNEYKTLINWQSPQQLVTLFKELGLNVINKDGKISVDDQVLSEQKDKSTLIPLLLEFSEYKKATGTYGEKFLKYINKSTGRIHPNFTQLVDTSRISSNTPNLQNIPATSDYRHCFVPEEGNIICDADYSGQESVLLVNFSKEKNLVSFYKNGGGDLHSFVAKLTFPDEIGDTPIEEVKAKFKNLRQIAKTVEFAVAYGGTGFTISKNTGLKPEEGDRIYNQYMSAFSGLADYFKEVGKNSLKNGYITISKISGRKYHISNIDEINALSSQEYLNDDGRKKLMKMKSSVQRISQNYPIQGTGAETIKISGVLFWKWIKAHNYQNKVKIINIVHDEIVAELPKELEEDVKITIKSCMENAAKKYCPIIPLTAEPEFADYWIH